MPASTPTIAELRSALGIGSLYSDTVVDEVCQSAQDIVFSYLWLNNYNIIARECTTTLGTVYTDVKHNLRVGDTVTIENVRSHFNGNKTITKVTDFSISYVISHTSTEEKHQVIPYGTIVAYTAVDYATVPAVNQAALMIAVDIWQARQASNAGSISPDFQPSPYRMGNTLTARVRGLLAPYLSPNSLVG
jgi:hypothetical protein